jgi:hypothetical protein
VPVRSVGWGEPGRRVGYLYEPCLPGIPDGALALRPMDQAGRMHVRLTLFAGTFEVLPPQVACDQPCVRPQACAPNTVSLLRLRTPRASPRTIQNGLPSALTTDTAPTRAIAERRQFGRMAALSTSDQGR